MDASLRISTGVAAAAGAIAVVLGEIAFVRFGSIIGMAAIAFWIILSVRSGTNADNFGRFLLLMLVLAPLLAIAGRLPEELLPIIPLISAIVAVFAWRTGGDRRARVAIVLIALGWISILLPVRGVPSQVFAVVPMLAAIWSLAMADDSLAYAAHGTEEE